MIPAEGSASWANVPLSKSMMRPAPYGPRSVTVHVAVAPFDRLVIVTTVPFGRVWWAHSPGR